jgi:endo-1,4-beta-mannosidase
MYCDNSIQGQQDLLSCMAAWGSTVEVYPDASSSVPYLRLSRYLIKLEEIKFGGVTFQLNAPISVALYQEDGLWNCEYEACGILSIGNTPAEAVRSCSEDFSVLWDEIAQCSDESLTKEAQEVKQYFLSIVKSVKTR